MRSELFFHSCLTEDQRQIADRSLQSLSFVKGQGIHRHGDACVGIILIQSGSLRFSVISEEGREVTLFRADDGEQCVLSAACVLQGIDLESHVTAEATSRVQILPASVLAQLMNENKDVERLVFRRAAAQYSKALQTMERIVFFSLEKRLALFLKEETVRQRSPFFHTTHEQIARCIGSSREVVTRMLNQFADRGIVSLGRGTVRVTDPASLQDVLD